MRTAVRGPLMAVFGRNDATTPELDTARRYGAAIARLGATLLTGGVGNGAAQIKEQAIEGAIGVDGASWIGVQNGKVPAEPVPGRSGGLVLRPGVGHRRNFLGACLCDAGVVLPGGQGTASELLFALALGRPLVLVGRKAPSWDELRAGAQERVPRPDRPRTLLDRAITAAYDAAAATMPTAVALSTPVEQVVAQLLSSVEGPTGGERLADLTDQAAWDALLRERAAALLDDYDPNTLQDAQG
jgi:predicted Rossmann-fold nucleotide-binding protein